MLCAVISVSRGSHCVRVTSGDEGLVADTAVAPERCRPDSARRLPTIRMVSESEPLAVASRPAAVPFVFPSQPNLPISRAIR